MIADSCFNVFFSLRGIPAVWNSLRDTTVFLSEIEAQALKDRRSEALDAASRDFLLERGILTEDPEELQTFLKELHALRQLRSPHFRILTTTACNAGCAYCYERGFPRMSMAEATAVSTAEFIRQQYQAHPRQRHVHLEWFGGEPTLNPDAIDTVTNRLRQDQVPFSSSMISNGLLLTEELICRASRWNLKSIQITLDAADEQFEQIKGVPAGSFDTVLKNMDACLSAGIQAVVRINYAENAGQVRAVIHRLADRYSESSPMPKVYISPLYAQVESIPAACMEQIMALNEELIQTGLMTLGEVYNLSQRDRCFCTTPWGFTILPDGRLVNCSHNISHDNSFGTVWKPNFQDPLHQKFLSMELSERCHTCPLLPVCGGGCSAAQYHMADMHLCIPYRNVITQVLCRKLEAF